MSFKQFWLLLAITILAFSLRVWRLGEADLKEEEYSTVKAASYVYHCQNDPSQCRHQPVSLKNKFFALITANETVPNLGAEIYLWDFIKGRATAVHQSRAWPHLYVVAGVYQWLGINEFSSRLISVIAGSLLVIAGYWLSRTLGGSVKSSLLYSALLAMAFPLIDFSRNARMYSLYILVYMLLVGCIYRSKWLAAGLLFLLAYWLQLLTLILPLSLLVWAGWERRRRLVGGLLFGFFVLAVLSQSLNLDFFQRQFLTLAWPPHWQYLNWWLVGTIIVMIIKRQIYLLSIILVYLIVLIFFTRPAPGGAYVIALWPLILWPLLNWRRWLTLMVLLIVLIGFAGGINYLYFGRDGRAQIKDAYQVIIDHYQPDDTIYAVQLRDYYLQGLPPEIQAVDLQKNPDPDFSGSGFVIWEREKIGHFKPEVIEYVKSNFNHLAGDGLDNWGVEIYSFGK